MVAIVVYVTVPNKPQAEKLSRALVKENLAACVSIVPVVESIFVWKGKVQRSNELLLIIKTSRRRYKSLEKRVRAMHSYDVPEIIALPIVLGNPAYLEWLKSSMR
jgi:periplasmic divalent cation tolerance protein